MLVHKIDGILTVTWNEEAKAIIDTWDSYYISLEQFRDAVLIKGVDHASKNGGIAWIVDSSNAKGAFANEIQEFIGTDVFPKFAEIGIKYFITITSKQSAMTRITISTYSAKTGPNGLQLVEVNTVDDAIKWLQLQ
jgi:hypothetical protein